MNNGEIQAIDVDEVDGPNGNFFKLINLIRHFKSYFWVERNRIQIDENALELKESHFDPRYVSNARSQQCAWQTIFEGEKKE